MYSQLSSILHCGCTPSPCKVRVSKSSAVRIFTLSVCSSHSTNNLRWSRFFSLRSSRMEQSATTCRHCTVSSALPVFCSHLKTTHFLVSVRPIRNIYVITNTLIVFIYLYTCLQCHCLALWVMTHAYTHALQKPSSLQLII